MNTWNISFVILAALIVFVLLLRGRNSMVSKDVILAKLQQGGVVIDVRTPEEFSSGHYHSALNIPLNQLKSRLNEIPDKRVPLIVYCASGMRSETAKKILLHAGFTDVSNAGGLGNMPKT